MGIWGMYRIVKEKGSGDWQIARDFVSERGLGLAFGTRIRFRENYDILPEYFHTPEEAYEKFLDMPKQDL